MVDAVHRQQRLQLAAATQAFNTERLQLQTLVIEQQMALIRLGQLYEEYKQDAEQRLIEQGPGSQEMTINDERSPNPLQLVRYQEASLTGISAMPTEAENLQMVLNIASQYIDHVLNHWTRLPEIDRHVRQIEFEAQSRARKQYSEHRASRQPRVDEESSDEESAKIKHPRPRSVGPGPLLMPANEYLLENFGGSVPIPVSGQIRSSRGQAPYMHSSTNTTAGNPSRSAAYLPLSPPNSAGSGASPVSPRVSFSNVLYEQAPSESDESGSEIPWRLRMHQHWWDYRDDKIVGSDTNLDPSQFPSKAGAITEVSSLWVSKEAIEHSRYEYTVQKDVGNGRKTKLQTLFCINRALTFVSISCTMRVASLHLLTKTSQKSSV